MTQVSKKYLSKEAYRRIFEIFIESLISIKNRDRCEKFINDLLTDTEKIMLAKRLSVAFLLIKNYKYATIASLLKVSKGTVWHVKRWMNERGEGYKIILTDFINHEATKESFNSFFDFLEDLLPPPRGTNWTEVRRKQWENRRRRIKPF